MTKTYQIVNIDNSDTEVLKVAGRRGKRNTVWLETPDGEKYELAPDQALALAEQVTYIARRPPRVS